MENEILQQILSELKDLKQGQVKLEQGQTKLVTDMEELKQDMSDVKIDVTGLKLDVTELKQDMAEVKQDVAKLKLDVTGLKQDMAEVKQDISNIKVKLENETNKHIQIIAEGHIDIIRRLDYIQPIVENLEDDVAVIKSVVTGHSKEITLLKSAL